MTQNPTQTPEESYLVTVEKYEPLTISLQVLDEMGSVIRPAYYRPDMEIILSRINRASRPAPEAKRSAEEIAREKGIKRTVYEHGGSRIWKEEENGSRELIADTYGQPLTDIIFEAVIRAERQAGKEPK